MWRWICSFDHAFPTNENLPFHGFTHVIVSSKYIRKCWIVSINQFLTWSLTVWFIYFISFCLFHFWSLLVVVHFFHWITGPTTTSLFSLQFFHFRLYFVSTEYKIPHGRNNQNEILTWASPPHVSLLLESSLRCLNDKCRLGIEFTFIEIGIDARKCECSMCQLISLKWEACIWWWKSSDRENEWEWMRMNGIQWTSERTREIDRQMERERDWMIETESQ